jgi:hypothetical protein
MRSGLRNGYAAYNMALAELGAEDLIVLLDADCIASPGLLARIVAEHGRGAVAGTAAKRPLAPRLRDRIVWAGYNGADGLCSAVLGHPYTFFASPSFFDRAVLDGLGGFRTDAGPNEDWRVGRAARRHGRVAYIGDEHVVLDTRRYRSVGYGRYWWRTRTGSHPSYPPGSEAGRALESRSS